MNLAAFDARYRADPDPWGYRTSPYEQAKYADTLAACGPGPFASALELGCSIGVFSAQLAPRCRALTCLDGSAVAVSAARESLADLAHVEVRHGRIPDDLTPGDHDLIVASEVLYYLDPQSFEALLGRLEGLLAPGGRIVLVHWRAPGPERPLDTEFVHDRIGDLGWLTPRRHGGTAEYRLDVLERPR